MPVNKFKAFVSFLLLVPCLGFAQNQIQLASLLNELEQRYNVYFNYLNQDIKSLELTRIEGVANLKPSLKQISFQLPVDFEFLDESTIVVKRQRNYYCIQLVSQNSNHTLPGVYIEADSKMLGKTYANGTLFCLKFPKLKPLNFLNKTMP